ncbi:DUF4328 domain-containing protein [Chloroflexota bacterium]
MKPFKSGHRRAQLVFITFGILVVLFIVTIAFLIIDIDLRQQIIDGETASFSEHEDSNDRVALMGKICMYASIFAGIPFLLWLYKAHANLPALGAKGLKFSTGDAVGWFLVPIFNLFRPYQVADETWNGSNPNVSGDTNRAWNTSSPSVFVGFWWGQFLFSLTMAIIALVVVRVDYVDYSLTYAGNIEYLEDFVYYRYWNIVFLCAAIVSFFTTILFVRSVDQRQKEKYKLVGEMSIE